MGNTQFYVCRSSRFASAVLNGKLYAIGGVGLSSVEVFDPLNGSWSAGVALPSEVIMELRLLLMDKIYLVGGRNASEQNIIKFFALIHLQVNGLLKPICQRLGME